jgi:hypothetical protein
MKIILLIYFIRLYLLKILTSLEENLIEEEYFELIETIEQHFDAMLLKSEMFYSAFISALHNTTLFRSKEKKVFALFIALHFLLHNTAS